MSYVLLITTPTELFNGNLEVILWNVHEKPLTVHIQTYHQKKGLI